MTEQEIIGIIEKTKKDLDKYTKALEVVRYEKYNRVDSGDNYWYISSNTCAIDSEIETGHFLDSNRCDIGNYYLNKVDALRAEKQVRLFRLLDRFSRQNGWHDSFWRSKLPRKYCIIYNSSNGKIEITSICASRDINGIYFVSEEIAQKAIEKYGDLIFEVMKGQ